ncbi:O-succinylbenzoic acid--CoA ligase [Flavobacterium micromati]|uniref:O-succinylbenzoic acid--CoA ligase n=1 Tax=Flavobacterium micromati TaxID=229205 RepID=A0A1M5INX3_9FLAO|nr:AMP-binding protein [Flavobacterium micromati]SHG29749.1 O-succinylbenzoic acid--CoA ligase [Flavobacterium micromati]
MTNTINYNNVHNLFKINGFHFKRNDLCSLAYILIKEGEPFEKAMGDFLLDWFDAKSYLELNTSGTTGTPKTIKIEKQAMINSALASGDFFDLKPGNTALHCLPTNFIAGKMMLVRAFILGLDIDFVSPSSRPLLNKDRSYDFAAMVPLQVQNSIAELFKVKKMIVGGAKMNHELESQLANLKTEVYETYGMTETITHIAAKRVGEEAFSLLPNVKIGIDDRNCLVIDAPNISNELIVTNDLVSLIDEDHFVFIGRIDNLINSGGIKLVPEKIEDKLSQKIHSRFFVAGMKDEDLGEKLVLIIEGDEQELEDTIFKKLDKYERPKEIFYVKKFAETENGKVKRKEILESL